MGLFHRDKKNNDDEPDSVQTNSFSDIMNGLQYAHAETGGLVMYEKLLEEGTFANLLVVIGATVVYVFQPSAFQDLVECPYRGVVARIA